MLRKNQVSAGFNLGMTDDGSRVFAGSREHQYAVIPYDFSGTTFYPAGPIVMSGGQGSGPDPSVFGTARPVPDITGGIGCLNGYRSVTHSGTIFAVSVPSYPEAFGAGVYPYSANQMGTGIILIYRYTLTSVFRGNSLFEGYVKCDNLTIGSSGGSVDHARLKFGGRKGEVNSESGATIENRWMGTRNAVFSETANTGYKHDNELLISKSYSTLHEPNDTVKYGDWNKRDFFGDRVRIKAPKIEFQIHTPQSDQLNNKYRESPCVSITDMNNPFGGQRGMSYYNDVMAAEPRQLMSIRTGTSNSRLQAGLRLIAGEVPRYVYNSTDLRSSIASDGDYYTLAPGNDGWLRLLCPDGQGNSTHYQTETYDNKDIVSNYAGLAVGDIWVAGSIRGPGTIGGGSAGWATSGNDVYYNTGNVGVGTTNPQGVLHISSGTAGDCRLIIQADTDNNDENDNPRIEFWQDGSIQESAIGMTNNKLNFWNSVSSGGGISFYTNAVDGWTNATTERLTITSTGDVGINQPIPTYTLDVDGTIRATTDIVLTSDRRLKRDIKKIEGALDKICKISGYTYIHNEQESTGCIAQEVKEVLPQVVRGTEESTYSIAYGNMMGIVIEAIKELRDEISNLKTSNGIV